MTDTPTRQQIDELLSEVYTDEGIDIWWRAKNRNFGGRTPLAVFTDTDEDEPYRVLAEAERLAGGAW